MENVFPKYTWHQCAHSHGQAMNLEWVGVHWVVERLPGHSEGACGHMAVYPAIMQTLLTSSQRGSVSLAGIWRQSTQKRGAFLGCLVKSVPLNAEK